MSNLPKKAEDKVNVFGIVLIGVASAILIWASAVALQAYYMNTTSPLEAERDQVDVAKERRAVQAEQDARLQRLEHNDAFTAVSCVSNPIEVAMTAVVSSAQAKEKTLVPAIPPILVDGKPSYYKPTIDPIFGYPSNEQKSEPTADAPKVVIDGDNVLPPVAIAVGTDGKLVGDSGVGVAAVARLMLSDLTIGELTVNSFTDNRGVEEDLLERTQARAQIVVDQLVKAGVDAARLRPVGNGSANPVGDNTTDEGRAKNNRIELVISKRAEPPPPGDDDDDDDANAPAPDPDPAPAPAPAPDPDPANPNP